MTAPRRRWFRFSLATMLVAVAIAGIGFAWLTRELAVIRERQDLARLIEAQGGGCGVVWQRTLTDNGFAGADLAKSRIPWQRTVLGDDTAIIVLAPDGDTALFGRAKRVFPEASVLFDGPLMYRLEKEQAEHRLDHRPSKRIDRH